MAEEVVRVVFTTEDVATIADAAGIDLKTAFERAFEWGRHIEATVANLAAEQLESVIKVGQP